MKKGHDLYQQLHKTLDAFFEDGDKYDMQDMAIAVSGFLIDALTMMEVLPDVMDEGHGKRKAEFVNRTNLLLCNMLYVHGEQYGATDRALLDAALYFYNTILLGVVSEGRFDLRTQTIPDALNERQQQALRYFNKILREPLREKRPREELH